MTKNTGPISSAIIDFTGGNFRNRIFVGPDIPAKKLVNAQNKYITRNDPIVALIDDTLFGSAKDGLAISENYVYAKGTLGDIKSVKISSIRSVSSQSNKLGSLDIYFGGNLFVTLSTIDKEDHDFVIGILKAAFAASKVSAPAKVSNKPKAAAEPKLETSKLKTTAVACAECSVSLPAGAKFCLECGAKVVPRGICQECKTKLPEQAKFCLECGTRVGAHASKATLKVEEVSVSENGTQNNSGSGGVMKIDFEVTYNNADTAEQDQQTISLETDLDELAILHLACEQNPTQQNFVIFFRKIYDNTEMDGGEKGLLYDDLWPVMRRWAFDKLGWHDVTIDVHGCVVNGIQLRIDNETMDVADWSLQLSRDGFMYCYS